MESARQRIMPTQMERSDPEIFLGLVGAVGTDLRSIGHHLKDEFHRVGYSADIIRLSDLMLDTDRYADLRSLTGGYEDERIDQLMDAGDDFRAAAMRGDAVALLAISKVRALREALTDIDGVPSNRHAYIFHSLKHPHEVDTLRKVYGQALFIISIYSPRHARLSALSDRISRSRQQYAADLYSDTAERLIEKDEQELGKPFGQNVRETFPLGDVFIDCTELKCAKDQITRFIEVLFSSPYITPTMDEYGMFHAKAAALRSADLSRQVGAVIMTDHGEIVAAGCNEVPKAGGGAVWEGELKDKDKDHRDFRIGHDSTARMKQEIMAEIFGKLQEMGWLSPELKDLTGDELAVKALYDGEAPPLKGSRAASILEFGRMVHAEMFAISDAARRGISVLNATLYCTTFPCHMCARHIIATGLHEVVYIEPYPKSMAKELYRKSIRVDYDTDADLDAVVFRPFVGIAPRRYIDLFEMPERKDARGHTIEWKPDTSQSKITQIANYDDGEVVCIEFLDENRVRLRIRGDATQVEGGGDNGHS
jgi:deoxycytidylate deaminase